MYSFSGYLTACAAVLVATLVVAEPLDRRVVNDKTLDPALDHDVIPVTSQRLAKRIINGLDAQPGSHPYIALLWANAIQLCKKGPWFPYCTYMQKLNQELPDSFVHLCGGSLIHESWVLTAAHCVSMFSNDTSFSALKVVLGEHDKDHDTCTEQQPGVKHVFVHPERDIALVELSTPARISETVQIAKLSHDDSAFVNTECVVAGWGTIAAPNITFPGILQEAKTTVIPNDECEVKFKQAHFKWEFKDYIHEFGYEKVHKDIYPLFKEAFDCKLGTPHIRDDKVCIMDQTEKTDQTDQTNKPELNSVCFGDSGGPLMCGCEHNSLVGVTAHGADPTCPGEAPQVYMRVSAFIDFIESTAKIQV